MIQDMKDKKQIQLPFDELEINWSFVEIPQENYILGVKPHIQQVGQYLEKGGEPVIDPTDKKPKFFLGSGATVKLFTHEEYLAQKQIMLKRMSR